MTVTHCGRICFKGRKVNLSGMDPLTVASTSIPSWNQIAAFLQSMQRLRDSVGFAA